MSTLAPDTPYPTLLAFLVLGGGGMGLFNSPNMSSAMGSVPAHRRGVASGLRATFFNIGFVLSFNIVILVLTFYLPYGLITQIITSEGAINTIAADAARFSSALDNLFLVLTVINTAAIVPSLLRGTRVESGLKESETFGHEPD
jgi:MFS family permease